jgi:hypothetical protein
VPIATVLEPLVGRTTVPNASALFWLIVTGWMMVVVPVVVAELDCPNAGEAMPVSIASTVAVLVTSFIVDPRKRLGHPMLPASMSRRDSRHR